MKTKRVDWPQEAQKAQNMEKVTLCAFCAFCGYFQFDKSPGRLSLAGPRQRFDLDTNQDIF